MAEKIDIALAGNPNCGKTTLFNELTGSNGYVGNWPGVTVEKKEAVWKKDANVLFTDLPGIYSLSPYSPEEVVSRYFIISGRPSAIVDLVDVTNIERNLYLTTQILDGSSRCRGPQHVRPARAARREDRCQASLQDAWRARGRGLGPALQEPR